MTEKRKLQQEIERVLKRVAEGVEEFEGLWDKVHTTSNSAQREKFEGDLKKEIKKLQRLRDQIKTWQQSNDIKDKSDLLKNRKLIETQMERFKVMEREMKTKTFSKGGLSMASKVDPNAKAKQEIREWINQFTDQLTIQVDQFEAEIEALNSKKKKTKKEEERVHHLDMSIARHRDHEKKLEIILRMLDNDSLNVEQVDELKDDLDYYLENNQEADFNENEYLYDDLNLDLTMQDDDDDDDESQGDMDEVKEEPKDKKKSKRDDKDEEEKQEVTKKPSLTKQVSIPKGTAATPQPQLAATRTPSLPTSTPVAPAAAAAAAATPASKATPSPAKTAAAIAKGTIPATPTAQPPTPFVIASAVAAGTTAAVAAAAVTAKKTTQKENIQPLTPTSVAPPISQISATDAEKPQFLQTVAQAAAQASVQKPPQKPVAPPAQSTPSGPTLMQQQAQLQAQLQAQQQQLRDTQRQIQQPQPTTPPAPPQPDIMAPTTTTTQPATVPIQQSPSLSPQTLPLPKSEQGLVMPEVPDRQPETQSAASQNATMQALFSSLINMPEISDSERSRTYMPRNPASMPPYFPTMPAPILENQSLLEKFDAETLFFMFYHQPGTYQQYLAARELKRQSWRFHKKYLTWFQRLEDPKVITDEYEQGTYVYFDYETGWCQRRKADFKFEYRFLEDQELP